LTSKKIKRLVSEYGIAFLVAAAMGFLMYFIYFKKVYPKYRFNTIQVENISEKNRHYADLNNDGISEEIEINHEFNTLNKSYVSIRTNPITQRSVFSQLNWEMAFVKRSNTFAGDYDHDGKKELFLFFRTDSTIFLDGVKLNLSSNLDGKVFFHKRIDSVKVTDHRYEDFICYINGFADVNHDGFQDLIFNINGFYCAYPRKLYCYDIANDSLYSTDEKYQIYSDNGYLIYKQKEHYFFLPRKVRAPGNSDDSTLFFNDHHVWNFLINDQLKPAFKPQRIMTGYSNFSWQCFAQYNGKPCYVSALTQKNKAGMIAVYDFNGKRLASKKIRSDFHVSRIYPSLDTTKYFFEILTGNKFLYYDKNLNIVRSETIPNQESFCRNMAIVSNDENSEKEFIAMTDYGQCLKFFDHDFNFLFKIKLDKDMGLTQVTEIKTKDKIHYVDISDGTTNLIISYSENPHYYLSNVYSLFTAIFFFFLINMAYRQRIKYIQSQTKREKELIESQLKIANRQMSPHFQLNVLNSISYLFEKDKKKAQYYLGKYSRLVTETMMNVDKIETTLTNEINFIRNFLSLEQLRLNHLFDFKINLDEKIDPSIMIPRMLLFTFCENAVKHGLKPKGEGGSLIISGILTDQKNLVFTIEDNGIGRKNAAKQKTQGTGMGLKTLNKIISYYNESHNKKITYTLFDRKDGGTIVSIMIKN